GNLLLLDQAFSSGFYFRKQRSIRFPVPNKKARGHSHHRISKNRIINANIIMLSMSLSQDRHYIN
ncbi:MAG: hypothetical protein IJ189_07285, partial [Clostridia bacterium]|nr:hypothetical protein [Clostridia bacterium]